MARIRKTSANGDEAGSDPDPQALDDVRRFVNHADDLIAAQRAVADELAGARAALDKAVLGYDRTALAIARREREGISVRLEGDVDAALRRIRSALVDPVLRAEGIAREVRLTAALSGLAGGIIGAAGIAVLLLFGFR